LRFDRHGNRHATRDIDRRAEDADTAAGLVWRDETGAHWRPAGNEPDLIDSPSW
jgi:hypothetical protein